MSLEYSTIVGYGIKLEDYLIFDCKKIVKVISDDLKSTSSEKDFMYKQLKNNVLDFDILYLMFNEHGIYLSSTGDMYNDQNWYIHILPHYPWEGDILKFKTEDEAQNYIINTLKIYLRDDLNIAELKKKFDYINDVRCD